MDRDDRYRSRLDCQPLQFLDSGRPYDFLPGCSIGSLKGTKKAFIAIGLGLAQRMLICGLADTKDQIECPVKAHTISCSPKVPQDAQPPFWLEHGWRYSTSSWGARGMEHCESAHTVPRNFSWQVVLWILLRVISHPCCYVWVSRALKRKLLTCQPTGYHLQGENFELRG